MKFRNIHTSQSGFTLVEFIITVVIVGVLASLALIGHNATMQKVIRRNSENNLKIIHTSANNYKVKNKGEYAQTEIKNGTPADDLAEINDLFDISIVDTDNVHYKYDGYQEEASAEYLGSPNYTLTITLTSDILIDCTSGACSLISCTGGCP